MRIVASNLRGDRHARLTGKMIIQKNKTRLMQGDLFHTLWAVTDYTDYFNPIYTIQ